MEVVDVCELEDVAARIARCGRYRVRCDIRDDRAIGFERADAALQLAVAPAQRHERGTELLGPRSIGWDGDRAAELLAHACARELDQLVAVLARAHAAASYSANAP